MGKQSELFTKFNLLHCIAVIQRPKGCKLKESHWNDNKFSIDKVL